jgi:hypothetical protein
MTLDDLMTVWGSQDKAPLHGVNETLLRLALRKDEATLRTAMRVGRWLGYFGGALTFGLLAYFLIQMIRQNLPIWDYAYPVVGFACAMFWLVEGAPYRQKPALPEQSFGVSLRDQLSRYIAQYDRLVETPASLRYTLLIGVPGLIGSIALFLTVVRVNGDPVSDVWTDAKYRIVFIGMILLSVIAYAGGMWVSVRSKKRSYLPHKQRLEALLKELDGQ